MIRMKLGIIVIPIHEIIFPRVPWHFARPTLAFLKRRGRAQTRVVEQRKTEIFLPTHSATDKQTTESLKASIRICVLVRRHVIGVVKMRKQTMNRGVDLIY